jgi:DNA-binding response OmpR family regulator
LTGASETDVQPEVNPPSGHRRGRPSEERRRHHPGESHRIDVIEQVLRGARAPADSLHFIDHRGATLTREELLNEVWGYHAMPSTRTVDVHVAWLRQKIEPNSRHPQYILTIHGMGYKFAG